MVERFFPNFTSKLLPYFFRIFSVFPQYSFEYCPNFSTFTFLKNFLQIFIKSVPKFFSPPKFLQVFIKFAEYFLLIISIFLRRGFQHLFRMNSSYFFSLIPLSDLHTSESFPGSVFRPFSLPGIRTEYAQYFLHKESFTVLILYYLYCR